MIRQDFFEILDYATDPPRRREVLDQRHLHRRRGRRAAGRPWTTSTSRSRSTAPTPTSTTRSAARAPSPRPSRPWSTCGRGLRSASRSASSSPATTSISSTTSRRSPTPTALSCASPACGPSGRGADSGPTCTPPTTSSVELYHWLMDRPEVLTGDSFFHLSAFGEALPGLNLCGAGRVVCLIDPVGDVYACPFVIHDEFLAGNVPRHRRLHHVWRRIRPVPVAARAVVAGRLRLVRQLRRLPGRLHGLEVLRGPAARRPRPRVREGPCRAAARGPRSGSGAGAVGRPRSSAGSALVVARLARPANPSRREPARTTAPRRGAGEQPGRVRPPRDQPGAGPGVLRTPRRVLRASRRGRRRRDRHRGGLGAPQRLALRAMLRWPQRVRPGWEQIVDGLPPSRVARDRGARSLRRAGLVGVLAGSDVGAVAGARGEHPRGPEVDGARRHRRADRRVRRRRPSRRGLRMRRCRDQRRPVLARPTVPVRPDQPARRRVGRSTARSPAT